MLRGAAATLALYDDDDRRFVLESVNDLKDMVSPSSRDSLQACFSAELSVRLRDSVDTSVFLKIFCASLPS